MDSLDILRAFRHGYLIRTQIVCNIPESLQLFEAFRLGRLIGFGRTLGLLHPNDKGRAVQSARAHFGNVDLKRGRAARIDFPIGDQMRCVDLAVECKDPVMNSGGAVVGRRRLAASAKCRANCKCRCAHQSSLSLDKADLVSATTVPLNNSKPMRLGNAIKPFNMSAMSQAMLNLTDAPRATITTHKIR